MTNIKNESHWSEIEDLPVFEISEKSKEWLYKFQTTAAPHLSALALIQLEALIRNVYEEGIAKGHSDEME